MDKYRHLECITYGDLVHRINNYFRFAMQLIEISNILGTNTMQIFKDTKNKEIRAKLSEKKELIIKFDNYDVKDIVIIGG